MKKVFACGLVFLFLVGCSPKSKYFQSQSSINSMEAVSELALDLEFAEEKIYLVDTRPDPSVRLSVAQAGAAGAQAAPMPPGAGSGEVAAGAAIGMVIGMQLVKMSQDASDQSRANEKAGPIEQSISKDKLMEMLEKMLRKTDLQSRVKLIHAEGGSLNAVTKLVAAPELHFSSDLSRMELKLNASIIDGVSQEKIYQNSFEYWSQPVGSPGEDAGNCSAWVESGCSLLSTHLEDGAREVLAMLLFDIEDSLSAEKKDARPVTNEIVNEQNAVFLRGNIIKVSESRVWVRDLRGNVRSIYGKLASR